MENNPKDMPKLINCNILQLDEKGIAERLWYLFNEKYLDIFVRDCEILQDRGFDLAALSQLNQYPNNFKVEYASMKRVLLLSTQAINLSKSSNQGWKVIDIDDKCTIAVRSKGTVLELKVRGTVDLNIKHACCAAYLINHYNECIPFCKEAKDILEPSRVEKVGFIRLSIPIPFIKDRSVLIRGVGYRLSDKPEYIHVFGEGINQEKQYLEKVKVDPLQYMKGRQLLDLKQCAAEVKCLGPKLIEFNASAIVDHHISFAPEKLVLFITKQLGKFILNSLFQKLRNFETTVWAKQMKENYNDNRQFYEWIDNIVDQCLSTNKDKTK